MSAVANGLWRAAVSPPEVDTSRRTEWPPAYSEKYRRFPSVAIERLGKPSLVICTEPVTTGGETIGRSRYAAASRTHVAIAATGSHWILRGVGSGGCAPDREVDIERDRDSAPPPVASCRSSRSSRNSVADW